MCLNMTLGVGISVCVCVCVCAFVCLCRNTRECAVWGKWHTFSGLHTVVLNAFSSNSRASSHTAQSSQPISPEQPKLISVMLKMALNIIKALFSLFFFFWSSSVNIFLSPDNVLEVAQKPGGVIKGTGSLAWSHSKDACLGFITPTESKKAWSLQPPPFPSPWGKVPEKPEAVLDSPQWPQCPLPRQARGVVSTFIGERRFQRPLPWPQKSAGIPGPSKYSFLPAYLVAK